MVVDDEAFNIEAVKGLMKVLKFEAGSTITDYGYNGEQAVQMIEKAIQEDDIYRYQLILTDCSMPFMDGYESSKRIRKLIQVAERQRDLNQEDCQYLKIFAITGHVEPEYIEKAKNCGIDKVFAKPLTAKLLGTILKEEGFINQIPPHIMKKRSN